jgi:hypothetical protein
MEMPDNYDDDIMDLVSLDMESRLTIAVTSMRGCACTDYFLMHHGRIIPSILKAAREQKVDPTDLFAEYARKVHERHVQHGPESLKEER